MKQEGIQNKMSEPLHRLTADKGNQRFPQIAFGNFFYPENAIAANTREQKFKKPASFFFSSPPYSPFSHLEKTL